MEEFAQTRAPDDLFDDDFTPLIPQDLQLLSSSSVATNHQRKRDTPARSHRQSQDSRSSRIPARSIVSESTSLEATLSSDRPQPNSGPQAVRGDRSATGGITKPKLTEDEMSELFRAVKIRNERKAELHALEEADKASYLAQERRDEAKQREEKVARKVQDGEREKNRLMKLSAQRGREWDEGKEDVYTAKGDGRASQFRRGSHGGVSLGSAGRHKRHANSRQPDSGREGVEVDRFVDRQDGKESRDGRARGGGSKYAGGRSRGRGNFSNETENRKISQIRPVSLAIEADFPALPGGLSGTVKSEEGAQVKSQSGGNPRMPATKPIDSTHPRSSVLEESSWADQVDAAIQK